MINTRSIILITAALIVAGITAFLARSLLSAPEAAKTTIVQQVASEIQVLVAADDVPTGHFLKKEDLTWQSWPGDNINENYTQKKSDAAANSQMDPFIGAVAKTPIAAGEPILNGRVVKPGSRGFMAAVLKPGYRAVSIAINSRTGLSGFIFPGDSVDILLTHDVEEDVPGNEGGKTEIQAAETVLTDIRVLAIDTQMTNETNTPSIGKIATFEVLPKQAEKIALMSRMGELSLSLRSLAVEGEDAMGIAKTADSSRNNVTYADEVSKVIAEQNGTGTGSGKKQTVKIVRADKIEDLVFTDPNK
ncbi:MAG: Flp pilus assembly protein CpaB [Alphaproteobacteria bacterium]|nr:Flp pilus assembly protein CpaB [Alphaproteobacteria bacterium]HPF46291.1 Flp pilus assembly protein CpaB [Emcibacteraceae bacterium]